MKLRKRSALLAACLVVGVSASIAPTSTEPAGAVVPLAYDFAMLPGSSSAGAATSIVWSTAGTGETYHSLLTFDFPIGMEFAHADSVAGVPPSPIEQRPHDGDVVGEHVWTAEFFQCGTVSERRYEVVWNEPFRDPRPGKVAELAFRLLPERQTMALFSIFADTDPVTGVTRYSAEVPTGVLLGFMCQSGNFREVGQFYSSPTMSLARNAGTPGPATTCVTALDVSGASHHPCATVELVDASTESLAASCTIIGTSGPDVLVGTGGTDVICGLGGNDRINGLAGDDVIVGGDGNDRLAGGGGNDTIIGGTGNDIVTSSFGDDVVAAGSGDDRVTGASGDDVLIGDDGNDSIDGGPGSDTIGGGPGDDVLTGGGNSNVLDGGAGSDACRAGSVRSASMAVGCE